MLETALHNDNEPGTTSSPVELHDMEGVGVGVVPDDRAAQALRTCVRRATCALHVALLSMARNDWPLTRLHTSWPETAVVVTDVVAVVVTDVVAVVVAELVADVVGVVVGVVVVVDVTVVVTVVC